MERFPSLAGDVEEVHLAVAVCVLTSDQDNLGRADSQGATRPEGVLKKINTLDLPSYAQ